MSIFIALLILSFLVFFHELGHFIVARLCGVSVEVFSIGFGKKIASVYIGHTQYALSLIPLGGYVKLKGQDDTNPKTQNNEPDSYLAKSPYQRIAILLAGPLFNLLLAFMLYVAVGMGGKISLLPIVGEVRADFPAQKAGIQAGDRILSINGKGIKTWEELDSMIIHTDGELHIQIERKNTNDVVYLFETTLTPIQQGSKNIFGEPIMRNMIGIASSGVTGEVKYNALESLSYGIDETFKASTLIAQSIVKLISGVVPSSEVGGVVSIVSVIGSASNNGWVTLFWLTALISVNLGILNLLPIPALDGGHIMFNCYEMIMHTPPNENVILSYTLWLGDTLGINVIRIV